MLDFRPLQLEDLPRLLTDYAGQDWSALISDYLDTRMN